MLKTEVFKSVKNIVKLIEDKDGQDTIVIDMENSELMVDYFIITTGNSETHIEALRNEIVRYLKDEGIPILYYDKGKVYDWVIIDTGILIIHIFSQEARNFYDLEGLWGEQKKIKVN